MTGLRRNFKASKFADKMCASGKRLHRRYN